jgi:protocatechuate 3,4-dioxygenase beta subunit
MNSPNHIERAVGKLHVATKAALDERIFADAAAALERATAGVRQPARPRVRHTPFERHIVRWAAVVAVTGVVVAGGVAVWQKAGQRRQRVEQVSSPAGPNVPPQTTRLAGQRQRIDALYAARDVDGLLQALNAGRVEDRIRAARYLGEIAGPRAIAALSPLAAQWQGDPAGNPFAQAIRQIEARTRPGEPNIPDPGRNSQSRTVPEAKPVRVLAGTISDAETGEPVARVIVQLTPHGGGRVRTATTDSNGVYGFDRIDKDGFYYVLLNAPEHITPADWERPREILQLRADGQVLRDYALERGGKLLIRAADENGRPIKSVSVYAAYVSDDMGRGPRRPSRSDANGVAVIGGLRPDTYFVVAAHPEFALAGEKIFLDEPGQVKSLMFDLKPGADVAGVATCVDGLPARGWRIEAKPQWWKSVYSWPRDNPVAEDGSFLLQHVLPGPHRLEVFIPEKDGGARGLWSTEVNLPPEGGWLDLKIPKPSPHGRVSIAGTVKFLGGGSYDQGFWIHAASATNNFGSTYVERGKQDFIIADLVPGLYDLQITLGSQRKEFKNIRAPSEGLVLEIAVPGILRVSGRVVDARTRQPVTDFALRGEGEQEYRRVMDPNGAFEVRTYGPECRVVVRADGYADTRSDNLCRDSNEPVVIELGPPAALKGVVVDEAGRPIEGATVHFRYRRSTDEPPDAKYITSTDRDGRFTVDNLAADDSWQWFVFRHPGYARAMKQLESGPDGATEVKVVLSQGGAVEGCLYDGQGQPLANTMLYFMDESHFGYWKENRARLGSVTTDDQGFYRMEHLPEELCYVFREDPDNQLGVVQAAVVPARGRTRRFDIGGPWKVAGRLLQEGQPMANTPLLATYEAGFAQGFQAYTVTDSDGQFAFHGLPTGQRSIYWAAPGLHDRDRWMMLGTFDFRAGVDLDLGDFEAGLAEVTVDMVMENAAMSPEGWGVVLQGQDERHSWARPVGLLRPRSEHSEPFVFSHVPAGRFEALAQREGYPTVHLPFEVTAGQRPGRILMTIPAGSASISGKVTSANAERPRLVLRSADERITAKVAVNPDGTFEVKNLPAGRYTVLHTLATRASSSALAEVALGPREHKTIVVDGDRADAGPNADGYLVVIVVTQDGIPLATPSVWLELAGRVILPHFNTDDGKSFAGYPGLYVLHAEYPGYRPVQTTVELKSRQGRTVQDTLAPLIITMIRQ